MPSAGAPPIASSPAAPEPDAVGSTSAILKAAPNPNAARLFQSYLYSVEAQQFMIDTGNLRSFHPLAKEKPSHKPFADITLMKDDPEAVVDQVEEIKRRYTRYFGT